MKMAAVCGSGLGSSFMVEMNIKTVLGELGINDVEVNHYDVGSAAPELADVFFVGGDLADSVQHLGNVVVLDSIIDMDELRDKVKKVAEENNLI
ncbi:PTS system, ascorbate-specific IIB component [Enterococcus sp. DIV2402]|jgi:PTS system ascorbate-specific IIB component|uniref:PTS system, ascorbate-specific IIB component n=1 Tax=Candidatus Enterococcus lowellii TaxID=2230877 RepID=A0ABZ2SNM3_9ENTE|nr:PTS sugar transporter subunit IIB [Enterococcus sp. DIV2402]MBO0465604.1 PTS sugar transporter subunit IIB [Enterococcus sp. DIV2402]